MEAVALIVGVVALVLAAVLVAVATRRWRASQTATVLHDHSLAHRLSVAEHQMVQAEAGLRNAAFGVLGIDGRGRVVFVNPAAQGFIGATHGAAVTELRVEEAFARMQRAQSPVEDVIEVHVPRHRHVGITAIPVDGIDGLEGMVYLEDLTGRVRVDEMRRDFLANVSHELKTPLGGLSVLAETLSDEVDPDARRRLSARLQGETMRMARLVEDLLDLSLVEAGHSERLPVVLQDLIGAAVLQVEPVAREREVALDVAVPDSEVKIMGDARQLEAAIANLIDNAIRYSAVAHPDGGGEVTVRLAAALDTVTIEVEDNGIGVHQSHHDRIFERFYRVDRARSRETGGTGLGLSIVKHVALNHGGDVAVDSSHGSGSVFRVRLPTGDS